MSPSLLSPGTHQGLLLPLLLTPAQDMSILLMAQP